MEVVGAHILVMFSVVVFAWIISQNFGPWVPKDVEVFIIHLVADPKISHLHGAGAMAFDGAVRNACRGRVIAMDRGGGLGMS